jgi:hypothetical protein
MRIRSLCVGCVLLALGLGLSAVSVSPAGIEAPMEFYDIEVRGGDTRKPEYARVLDGRLVLSPERSQRPWSDRFNPRSEQWYILGTKIRASAARTYLAYDPSGKDSRVFLSREAGEGTDWVFPDQKKGDRIQFSARVQAASGKVKGWYLSAEEYRTSDDPSDEEKPFRLVLHKKDGETRVYVNRTCAYRSTSR